MKRRASISAFIILWGYASCEIVFTGADLHAIVLEAEKSSGLNCVYVLPHCNDIQMLYTGNNQENVKWYKFGKAGVAYTEKIIDNTPVSVDGNCGYVIENGALREYIWIVNYSDYIPDISSMSLEAGSDCNSAILNIDGQVPSMQYHGVTGQRYDIDRQFILSYETLEYDETSHEYSLVPVAMKYSEIHDAISVNAPLCDTEFSLSSDRFIRKWDKDCQLAAIEYEALAVDARVSAEQSSEDNSNMTIPETSGLGGSAPAEISFNASISDAVAYTEWQISSDPEFEKIDLRYNDTSITHSFCTEGVYYVRFVAGNADGTCDYYSQVFEVSIGESEIKCPNAFSPGNGDGINDEWKVRYKSILQFDCRIFNHWGIEIVHLDHPSCGWDGKYKGKYVPSGVYYYVIDAKGADGKTYHLKGDINIIKFRDT